MNTHNLKVDFGKHKGELYTRLPISYLTWMINIGHSKSEIAKAELERRGTVMPTIEISGHAIDRASLTCRKIWHNDRGENEGLNAWLLRVSAEALEKGEKQDDKILWKGMKFVFQTGKVYPTLKTIMRKG